MVLAIALAVALAAIGIGVARARRVSLVRVGGSTNACACTQRIEP
jgi:hypothetical protein